MDKEERDLICIMCPMGCSLHVTKIDGEIQVSGNGCNRGVVFAKEELECPKRTLTTSVKTKNGNKSCKTTTPIPKDMIFSCMREIAKLSLDSVHFGDIILQNILGTGADVVITAND